MKIVSKILIAITALLSFTSFEAQIKNTKNDSIGNKPAKQSVKIYGNCGMCEKTIEKAGNIKGIAQVDWNVDTKMAAIIYDANKTNPDAILKRIALSGYDSDKFLAPDDAYSKLPVCCQYDREAKVAIKPLAMAENLSNHESHSEMPTQGKVEDNEAKIQEKSQLNTVFDNYFALKDALVKTDGNTASIKAKALLLAINNVKMEKLKSDEHIVWMKVIANLKEDVEHIAETKDAKHQRDHFDTLSKNIYALIKVSKQETPTYYQFCPMANDGKGANWLSKENTIKNPYYGSTMLSCGKVVETIK